MNLQSKNGKEIKPGVTLRRVVSTRLVEKGHEYKVIAYDWANSSLGGDDIVADGGHVKELIDKDRAAEYDVISE